MSQNKPLEPRQEAFCQHYIANGFNATKAAVSAGYSENSAYSIGSENLIKPEIKERIDELRAGTMGKLRATADDLWDMVSYAATFDQTEWCDTVPIVREINGIERTEIKIVLRCPLTELPPMARKMVVGQKQTKFGIEVQWLSKEWALNMLAKLMNMGNNEQTIRVKHDLSTKTEEELLAIIANQKAKLGQGE